MILVIQYSIKLMGAFELLFVNDLNLPFNSGCYFFIVLLAAAIVLGLRWAIRKGKHAVELAIFSFAFILIGYSSYAVIMICAKCRVSAVNMQNVNNPIDLVAYLDRDQYGEWPVPGALTLPPARSVPRQSLTPMIKFRHTRQIRCGREKSQI